jgi:hypothetical protein
MSVQIRVGNKFTRRQINHLLLNRPSVIEKFPKYGPLAAVALDAPSYLIRIDTGQHINYWIVENENAELFKNGEQFRFIKKGRGINDFSRMEPGDRSFFFCLHNDYKDAQVTVMVKITAVLINEKFTVGTGSKDACNIKKRDAFKKLKQKQRQNIILNVVL